MDGIATTAGTGDCLKRSTTIRRRLLAPLVYLAALLLLLEDWLWDIGARMLGAVAAWPPLAALEKRIGALPPYAALALFVLPAALLLPVKLIALFAMTHGHALLGLSVIIAAKVGGAAVVARLYGLTRPTLLSLPWFARWHDKFMEIKDRWVARLRATRAMRRLHALRLSLRGQLRSLATALRSRLRGNGGQWRAVRRILARWRAARRR
jgi:hypothetical protein